MNRVSIQEKPKKHSRARKEKPSRKLTMPSNDDIGNSIAGQKKAEVKVYVLPVQFQVQLRIVSTKRAIFCTPKERRLYKIKQRGGLQ